MWQKRKLQNALKQIAQELRDRYYWHDQYPTNVFGGIEERADVLLAAFYPLSNSTGCSYIDYLRESYRIQMAEETVTFMAKAIFASSKDGVVHPAGRSAPTFSEWEKNGKRLEKLKTDRTKI